MISRVERLNVTVSTRKAIPLDVLAIEPALMVSKWPAYRFMTPKAATLMFIDLYRMAVKDYLRRTVDVDIAEIVKPAAKLDPHKNNKHFTQLWKLRQNADTLGMPYDEFLSFCFDFAAGRTRTRSPQPNQLGPNPKTAVAWEAKRCEAWNEDTQMLALNRMNPMAEYALINDHGLPAQELFRKQLMSAARIARHFGTFIGRRVILLGQLSELGCSTSFGPEPVASAIRDAKSDVADGRLNIVGYPVLEQDHLWQACFGFQIKEGMPGSACIECPQQESCHKFTALVAKELIREVGSSDPIVVARREKGRLRTEKSRAKTKAAALLP